MASNRFGCYFAVTTFGESHGPLVGGVIDGCPAGVTLDFTKIDEEMQRRRPGNGVGKSERSESDTVEIVSGVEEGVTTGAPITFLIKNCDVKLESYHGLKDIYRPGHATYTYHQKYGHFSQSGGGRASARETAVRVAAGAIAKQIIAPITTKSYVIAVGGTPPPFDERLQEAKNNGDSLGALVEGVIEGAPVGLGEPVYEKLEARLAYAMMSIPATKGFEIGEGFQAARMCGSDHNDEMAEGEKKNVFQTNRHGGVLGGISTGEKIIFRVAFKPTSSIAKPQKSVDFHGKGQVVTLPVGSRHDVCVGLRAPPIVEAMSALTICDLLLMNRCSKISY